MQVEILGSGSSGNAYIISDGTTRILIEAGLPFNILMKRAGFKLPRFCFITHEHKDHSKAFKELARHGKRVFTSHGTFEALGGKDINGVDFVRVSHRQTVQAGSFDVMGFDTEHDVAEPLGFVFASRITGEQLLFATDTYFIRSQFRNISHFLIECNFSREDFSEDVSDIVVERALESHFSLEDLVLFFQKTDLSKAEKIFLLHLSENNLDSMQAKNTIQETTGVPTYLCKRQGGFI